MSHKISISANICESEKIVVFVVNSIHSADGVNSFTIAQTSVESCSRQHVYHHPGMIPELCCDITAFLVFFRSNYSKYHPLIWPVCGINLGDNAPR